MSRSLLLIALLGSVGALAQTATSAAVPATTTPDFSPPPLVPATPPPEPAADPSAPPMTPPPTLTPQGTPVQQPGYVPGQPGSGYTYSPYGNARGTPQKAPGPEVGLMVSESLFGMLSAAGTTILPYFLLGLGMGGGSSSPGSVTPFGILTVALFALTPVIVSQTQVGIANGSAYYKTDAWIPLLVGLAAEGIVLTTYFFANGKNFEPPSPYASTGGVPRDQGAVIWLFIGSLGVVPLLQMVAINLFKQPKAGILAKLGAPPDKNGFSVGLPMPAPVLSRSQAGLSVGAQLQFFRGTW